MNAPAIINVLAVAQAVMADPRKVHTVSTLQLQAMCRALVAIAAQDDQPLPSPCNAPFAVSVLQVVQKFDRYREIMADRYERSGIDRVEVTLELEQELTALKALFEKEFPNV